jgi:hypothetical protein
MRIVSIGVVLVLAGVAAAGPSQIIGKLVDSHQRPLEAATVSVGDQHATSTPAGVYRLLVPGPGTYKLSIDYADGHIDREITVDGPIATLDAAMAVDSETVIVVHDTRKAVVAPARTDDPNWSHQTPYSDEAVLSDRWAKCWLLLDIDDTGTVSRLKLLNDPGNSLAPIAIKEGFKMKFSPARDEANRPMPTLLLMPIEWPSYTWLIQRWGTASHFFNRTWYMSCRDQGNPITMDSVDMVYRDCTEPDLANAQMKKWIRPQ